MNHTLSDSQLEEMIKSAVNSSAPLPPDEKFSQLISALRELQERRKADSEPVAEVVSIYGDPEAFGEREIRPLVGIQQMPYGTKLYRHAQLAPVVPEEATPENVEMLSGYVSTYKLTDSERDIAAEIWNACRAAMLAAAPQSPGSELATVPGKWIPVSERMPETDGNYWGWWSESKRQGPVWFIKSELQAQFQSSEITHWMPLPAAPQEAINALIPLVSRNEQEVK
ncbi:DUF551 domain-containing protein [Klebsiella variicola]|uniref:DUF551 domain-containing protein n=1 Tax=Klebsiella variicola TaxID=244366 RepID=UPI0034D21EC7